MQPRVAGLLLLLAGGVALAGAGLWLRGKTSAAQSPQEIYRSYSASGQVLGVRALGGTGCEVEIKLHQWVSLSEGFTLAEMPQKGKVYRIDASPEHCIALEVALASQADPDDLKSPHHVNYKTGQRRSGEWVMTEPPTAPVGCGGL